MRKVYFLTLMLGAFLMTNPSTAATTDNDSKAMDEKTEQAFLSNIEYIEVEEDDEFDLGFDVYQYLPLDFDPFKGMIYELEDIEYIEFEEELTM